MAQNVIVGGGMYGAMVAWELAKQGEEVELIEARTIANQASGGPGSRGVRANGRDHRELPLMRLAREIWPSLHEELNAHEALNTHDELNTGPLFELTGHLQLIERDQDFPKAEVRVALQNKLGIETKLLSADDVRAFEPHVSPAILGAVYCPGDGVCGHAATTKAVAKAAVAAGAVIREGIRVQSLITRDDKVTALKTTGGDEIPVPGRLFLLANAGVKTLLAPWIDLPVWHLPFQVLLSEPLADNPVRHLVGHASRTLSLKQESDGRLMISGGRIGRWIEEEARGEPIDQEVASNVADAVAVYPSLAGLKIDIADTGHLEADSVDGIPIIDRTRQLSNLIYATGWSGHGWAISPATARLIAQWALEDQRPPLLAPFAFNRFG